MTDKNRLSRRKLIKLGMAGTAAGMLGAAESWSEIVSIPTPQEVEGPFYPVADQRDKDDDLTQITGQSGSAKGQYIVISGFIKDDNGQFINNAVIDIWQANAAGRYDHPRDPNSAQLDSYFQGWAVIHSDNNGRFRFKTVKPGAYPATRAWTRPPHIHFKISKRGFPQLITQMYFPDEPLNATDLLFNNKNKTEQAAMIAQKTGEHKGLIAYTYNIVLRGH